MRIIYGPAPADITIMGNPTFVLPEDQAVIDCYRKGLLFLEDAMELLASNAERRRLRTAKASSPKGTT